MEATAPAVTQAQLPRGLRNIAVIKSGLAGLWLSNALIQAAARAELWVVFLSGSLMLMCGAAAVHCWTRYFKQYIDEKLDAAKHHPH